MKLIKRIIKSNLSDIEGKYDLYYEIWYNLREFALPFNLAWWKDVQSFSILCFKFEKRKRYIPVNFQMGK
jgi:hypothetical protein